MTRQSNRKHPRVAYKGKVDLYFKNKHYQGCEVQNISLIGMWVLGHLTEKEGHQCDIEFQNVHSYANNPLRLKGEVVRTEEGGVALLFLNINVRTCNDLEALMAEQGDSPLMEENEFLDGLPA